MLNNQENQQYDLQFRTVANLANTVQTSEKRLPQHYDELWHELHVHQIELQMQNEELRQAHVALEASRAHYLELYDLAPVGYLTVTEQGIISEINLTGAKLLGIERKNIINRRFAAFIADEYKDLWYQHFMHAKQASGTFGCELPFRNKDNMRLYLHLECLYIGSDATPPLLRITLTDITERKQTEQALRIAAVAFEAQEAIIVADANKHILCVNQAFYRITGYSLEDATSLSFLNSQWHDVDFYRNIWESVEYDGYWQGEIWEKRKDGETIPLWITITAVTDSDGSITHFVSNFRDITIQKQAENVLFEAQQHLEKQVENKNMELEKVKEETAEINTAFNVLLKHQETDKSDAQIALSHEIEATVLPLLKRLRGSTGQAQTSSLINIIETNLRKLVKSYGHAASLGAVYQQLTPIEAQVASMVQQGLATKVIAKTLNVSSGTVDIHRKHIRKKLGLDSKAINLHSHLVSLTEKG